MKTATQPVEQARTNLTISEVAQRLAVSEKVILDWIKNGDLRAINVGRRARAKRRSYRVSEAALAEFEASRATTPPAPPAPRRRRQRMPDTIQFYR